MNGPEVALRLNQLVGCFLIFLILNIYIVLYCTNYVSYRRVIIEQRIGLELEHNVFARLISGFSFLCLFSSGDDEIRLFLKVCLGCTWFRMRSMEQIWPLILQLIVHKWQVCQMLLVQCLSEQSYLQIV